jgi:hypothetical protein
MCCIAVGTKTMTEKQTAPKPSQFIFIIFFALAGGLLFHLLQKEHLFFTASFQSLIAMGAVY